MESAVVRNRHRRIRSPLRIVIALAWLPIAGHAADAHRAVQAKPGDMVLLRNVSTRPADRPAPPGMALMVSPSPAREIAASLGTGELSDADFAQLDASSSGSARLQSTMVGRTLDSVLVHSTGNTGAVAGNGVSNTLSVPLGAVGNATRGIGDQIQGALAQFPLGAGH